MLFACGVAAEIPSCATVSGGVQTLRADLRSGKSLVCTAEHDRAEIVRGHMPKKAPGTRQPRSQLPWREVDQRSQQLGVLGSKRSWLPYIRFAAQPGQRYKICRGDTK